MRNARNDIAELTKQPRGEVALWRSGAVVACRVHAPEVVGSNPTSATHTDFRIEKLNMERWRNGRRGSYVQYVMFVALTAIYYSLGPASLMVQIHPSPFKAMAQMSLQIKKMRQLHE